MTNHVRAGSHYFYVPNMLDACDPRTNLESGAEVMVINLPGCPKANTMGHCYVASPSTGQFIGMVHINSLHTKTEYVEYLKAKIAEHETGEI